MIELLLTELKDPYVQENFRRIRNILKTLDTGSSTIINNPTTVISQENASKLSLTLTANEAVSIGDVVKMDDSSSVSKANISTFEDAQAIGVATENRTAGTSLSVLLFGVHEDPVYVFSINAPLFLKSDGTITDIPPSASGEFITEIGQSLGTGAIFINITTPTEIL